MSVLDNIDLKKVKFYIDEIKNNIDYLEEYGYAYSYKEDDDIVNNKYQKLCHLLNESLSIIEDISQIACDNFDN